MTLKDQVLEDKEKEEEERALYTPVVITDELIAEQVYSPKFQRTWYVVKRFESDNIERENEIRVELKDEFLGNSKEIIYRPLENDTLRKRLMLLPDAWKKCTFEEAYQKGCELAFQLYDVERSKMDEIRFLVGVAQSSWFLDRWFPDGRLKIPGMGGFAPIIPLRGVPGSGKDRLMNALRLNSYRPFYDVATTRAPSIYRPLDQWKGTLCMSEADFRYSTESSEVIKYLNCRSYGVPYSRQNPDNSISNDVFESFGLTIVTQRRVWEDNATEDRSLPFYCEKSQKPIPTQELDEWIAKGVELMDMLLYLRLLHWEKVTIDKSARIENLSDHRLTAAVLPLLAISKLEPSFSQNLIEVLRTMERKRKEVKAMSRDGIVTNFLWDKIEDGLVESRNGELYIGKEREEVENEIYIIPLTATDVAESLKWTAKEVRSVIQSLQLNSTAHSDKLRIGSKTYRPIIFDPHRAATRFADYVVNYNPKILQEAIHNLGNGLLDSVLGVSNETKDGVGIESDTSGTTGTKSPEVLESVADVADVADIIPMAHQPVRETPIPAQAHCNVCGLALGIGTGRTIFNQGGKTWCGAHFPRKEAN